MAAFIHLISIEGYEPIDLTKVVYCQADGNYTNIHYINEKGDLACHLQAYPFHDVSLRLTGDFILIRRGCMVNHSYIALLGSDRYVHLKPKDAPVLVVPKKRMDSVKCQMGILIDKV
jgi:DNA-binding LytR/AlgR family response regulator